MKALFDAGFEQGKSATAFANAPPPYPPRPATDPKSQGNDIAKPGAKK